MVDWSQLPDHLWCLVVERLPFLSDYIRFGGVSQSWRSIQREMRGGPKELPWILICDNDRDGKPHCFFSPSERKIHRVMIPELNGRRCCGSSHGYLVTVGIDLQMLLLHPFSRIQIPLPPSPSYNKNIAGTYTVEGLQDLTLWKAIMSSDPISSPRDCVVMAIHGRGGGLTFCRPGDKQWAMIDYPSGVFYRDVIYYKHQFAAVAHLGEVVLVSELGPHPIVTKLAPGLSDDNRYAYHRYLVESTGDLLQVVRYTRLFIDDDGSKNVKTFEFKVFKLDMDTREWMKVKSLGDRALILGYGPSMSLSARDFSGCKENAIYFTDDYGYKADATSGYEDLGVYSLGDGTIQPYYQSDAFIPKLALPLWLTPSLIINGEAI